MNSPGRPSRSSRKSRFTPENFLAWFPVVMRYGALLGVFHQAVWVELERPSLLALYGAMLGLSEVAEALKEVSASRHHQDEEAR